MMKTESIIIRPSNPQYQRLLEFCHLAKNLYNASLYDVRQHYFETKKHKTWQTQRVEFVRDNNPDYRALPAKISGEVLKSVSKNYSSFFVLRKKGLPARIPKYLKKDGVTTLPVPKDAISIDKHPSVNRHGDVIYTHVISPKGLNIPVTTTVARPRFITITPKYGHICIGVVYDTQDAPTLPDNGRYMGVDVGIDNLAACLDSDGNALLFKGKTIKSVNQYFNKKRAKLISQLSTRGEVKTSARLERLSTKRKNKISWHMHNISSLIVNYAVSHGINTIIVGHNPQWKQSINIGRVNNQKFVSIPFSMLIQQIQYKAKEHGINVIVTEESYTSKCSLLDREDICKHEEYTGRRIRRGLFRSLDGTVINADINAAGNIMRKVVPVESLTQGIEVGAVQPQTVHYAHS